MRLAHHHRDDSDLELGGWWEYDDQPTLCSWTWNADKQVLNVSSSYRSWKQRVRRLSNKELKRRLPFVALAIATESSTTLLSDTASANS
jgi:hypothetical protein